jgi:hypothetical protein
MVSPGMANPATLRYLQDVALPYAANHGIELHELRKGRRHRRPAARPLGPARVPVTPRHRAEARHRRPGTRSCTLHFKDQVPVIDGYGDPGGDTLVLAAETVRRAGAETR